MGSEDPRNVRPLGRLSLIQTVPAGPVPVLLYQMSYVNRSPVRTLTAEAILTRVKAGLVTRADVSAMSRTPFTSVAVMTAWYRPWESGGNNVKRNTFQAEGIDVSVARRAIAVKFAIREPDGAVRLIRAPAISALPKGAETLTWMISVSFGDHAVVEPTESRRSICSILTYVDVSTSMRDGANVEFIAK